MRISARVADGVQARPERRKLFPTSPPENSVYGAGSQVKISACNQRTATLPVRRLSACWLRYRSALLYALPSGNELAAMFTKEPGLKVAYRPITIG